MQSHEMITYEAPTNLYADPTAVIGVFLLYIILCFAYNDVSQYKVNKAEMFETIEKHHDVMTNSTPVPKPQNLQAAIRDLLQNNTRGLSCKQIVNMLISTMPDLTRKDVNTILYKMKVKKVVKLRSNFEKVPTWLLTPAS